MFKIKRFSTVTSTNDIIKDLAKNGAPEGTVAIANAQTAGRGRMGRSFMSPEGTGLYMSVLLRPKLSASSALLITTAAAAAVALAIEKHTGKDAYIKWVNDIFQNGKKVCGILTEGVFGNNGTLDFAVLGIGVNLMPPKDGFGDLDSIAGAVFENGGYDKDAFVQDILENFEKYYRGIENTPHYSDYVKRDILSGKNVDVICAGEVLYSAKVIGINKDFSIAVEHDGICENISTGEVSVRKKAN